MRNICYLLLAFLLFPVLAEAKSHDFSVWLIPQQKDNLYLQTLVSTLAVQYNTPTFRPHFTLYFGKTDSLDSVKKVIKRLVTSMGKNAKPIELTINGMDVTPDKFKSLYLTFEPEPELFAWSKQLGTAASQDNYIFVPHLSLLYKDMPLSEKRHIKEQIEPTIRLSSVTFDQIELIREDDPDNVNRWVSVYRLALAPP